MRGCSMWRSGRVPGLFKGLLVLGCLATAQGQAQEPLQRSALRVCARWKTCAPWTSPP